MTSPWLATGRVLPEFSVPVLNERAVRAGAGIMFFGAIVSFMNAWLMGNFAPTRLFVLAFLIDFSIRLFINPHYAPSLVLGQWMVRKQQPEWTGAPQKRFAWAIGFVLALTMLYLVVLKGVVGPVNLLVCGVCLLLLFFESAFGICMGCWIYNRLNPEQAQLCPGGVCEVAPDPSQQLSAGQVFSLFLFGAVVYGLATVQAANPTPARLQPIAADKAPSSNSAEAERCKVPDFAKAMGHEAKWKLHNNCS